MVYMLLPIAADFHKKPTCPAISLGSRLCLLSRPHTPKASSPSPKSTMKKKDRR